MQPSSTIALVVVALLVVFVVYSIQAEAARQRAASRNTLGGGIGQIGAGIGSIVDSVYTGAS